jgi:hypothetical protein
VDEVRSEELGPKMQLAIRDNTSTSTLHPSENSLRKDMQSTKDWLDPLGGK